MAQRSPGADTKRPSVTVHPLFLLCGVLTAFTGQLLLFLIITLCALQHECAHAFVARRYGFSLNKIVLMPYGAVISGDIEGISVKQEIAVCLAGPFINGVTALGFVALWWLFPETYPYTDVAAYASLSLLLVNLLPAYPLDGGRILAALLRPLGEKKAKRLCGAVSLVTAAALLGYFIYTCFSAPAFTALAFAVFLAAGSFGGGRYGRISFSRKKAFDRGIEEIRIAVSADCTVGGAVRFLREDRYLVLLLFQGEEFFGELAEEELLRGIEEGDFSRPLSDLLQQF